MSEMLANFLQTKKLMGFPNVSLLKIKSTRDRTMQRQVVRWQRENETAVVQDRAVKVLVSDPEQSQRWCTENN